MPNRPPLTSKPAAALLQTLLVALALAAPALAQGVAPASVSGRVREGERGLPGVVVALFSTDLSQRLRTVARAKTDAEGRYLISGVAPGRYKILPYAPAHVVQGMTDDYPPGRTLTLLAGEEVKDLDFQVEPGGVITGRVTDADGNPVVAEAVSVMPVEQSAHQRFDVRDRMTDDRGVYRIYGLQPGRYRVSVGQSDENTGAVGFGRRRVFRRTFHPDATEQSRARVVEVRAGQETDDVDITLGRALKTYTASGRFVHPDTGQPAPNVAFAYGVLDPSGRGANYYGGGSTTDARGEFRTEGLAPGRYSVFAMPGQEPTEFYSDPLNFEVTDADVTGLTVRLKRGATVSGVVQIEGLGPREAARRLSELRLFGWVEGRGQAVPARSITARVSADGTFRLTGLRPGRVRLGHANDTAKGLSLSRVELNGAGVSGGIEVAEGAQVSGVRYVLAYGTAVITGQATFANGTPTPGMRVIAQARRVGAADDRPYGTEVDARGFFRFEGLPAGEYEVFVAGFSQGRSHRSEPQRVSLADGVEAKVTPVLDFARPPGGNRP